MYINIHCRANRLTWHGNVLPDTEVWVKIGGDKGGGTFKMSFQVGNVSTPNAPENTFVFAVFEGHDSASNLHIALDQYQDQISEISQFTWRLEISIVKLCEYAHIILLLQIKNCAHLHVW